MNTLSCRTCAAALTTTFVDLGMSPLANSYRLPEESAAAEPFYPLHVYVCDACKLVQLPEHQKAEAIFSDYLYFSSWSTSWLEHCRRYVDTVTERFKLGSASRVIEVASNDGYLLQYFVAKKIPVCGIEPAANVAKVAVERGVPTEVAFFGKATAERVRQSFGAADLVIGNNVLAHVPNLNDFVAGLHAALSAEGVASLEFPHFSKLLTKVEFDTIYHEHFSYLSLLAVETAFKRHDLRVFDVEELPTHGGSLRVFACREGAAHRPTAGLERVRDGEKKLGLDRKETYLSFAPKVEAQKRAILRFLKDKKDAGKRVAGYGAPAKAVTLLNYCGVRADLIPFTVDRSTAKQGRIMPGCGIPIRAPEMLRSEPLDCVVILPWNLQEEIKEQLADLSRRGVELAVLSPAPRVL